MLFVSVGKRKRSMMVQAEITMFRKLCGLTSDEDKKMFQRIMDLLDEDDDVQNVYHNVEEDDE